MNLPISKSYFENLDAIRFILSLMVLFSHSMLPDALDLLWKNEYYSKITHSLFSGSQAVSFFFVLSGYLITYLLLKEKNDYRHIDLKNFYMRRILRIWPLYFFVLIFGFFIYPLAKGFVGWGSQISNDLLLNTFFLANFDSIAVHLKDAVGSSPMMITILWSVSIEEQFYLFWPLIFFFKLRTTIVLILAILVGSLIFNYLYREVSYIIYYHTLSRVMDLSIGGVTGYLCFRSVSFVNYISHMSKRVIILVYLIGGYVFLMKPESLTFIPNQFFLCLFYAFIIVEQSYCFNSFFKFKVWKLGSSMGRYTYGIYMLHPIGVQSAVVVYKLLGIDNTNNFYLGIIYVIIALVVGVSLAILSFHYFERYFLQLKARYK